MALLFSIAWKLASNPWAWVALVFTAMAGGLAVEDGLRKAAVAAQVDPVTHKAWKAEELADRPALALANLNLATAKSNLVSATSELATEEASVRALQAKSIAASARATAAVQAARAAQAALSRKEAQIVIMKPPGDDAAQMDAILLAGAQ